VPIARVRAALASPVFREIAVTYSGQLVGSGIGFLIQILLQRKLGSADYGLLALAGSVGMLTAVVTDLGLSHAMVRFASRDLAEGKVDRAMAAFAAAFWMRMGLAAVVALVGWATAGLVAQHVFDKPDLAVPLGWQFLGVFAGTAYGYWVFFIQSWQRFKLRSLVQVLLALAKLGAFGTLWFFNVVTPSTAIMLDMGVSAVGFVAGMAVSPGGLFRVPAAAWVASARGDLLPWCRYTGIMLLGDVIFNELDTFMLGIFSSEHVVGVYRCAWTYAMVLGFLNNSVSSVLFPKVTAIGTDAELEAFMRTIVRLTSLLAVATLPALPFLTWWIPFYDVKYADAVPVFYLMYVGIVFELVVGPLHYALYTLERPQFLVANAFVKIALNGGANLLLIPVYGALGAAAATIGTRVVGGVLTLWYIRRVLRHRARSRENARPPEA
jgi:O-antigen/teichoic acid export membrane protein